MLSIDTYQAQYQEQIVALILGIQVQEFGVQITLQDQPDLQNIPAFYQKNAGNFWVALEGDKVVGTIGLLDIGNGQSALRKMFVAKESRGKEQGVAQRLLGALFDWCKAHNIAEVYLGTVGSYFAAHRFYEKNDFVEINKTMLPPQFPLMAVDSKFYKYELV